MDEEAVKRFLQAIMANPDVVSSVTKFASAEPMDADELDERLFDALEALEKEPRNMGRFAALAQLGITPVKPKDKDELERLKATKIEPSADWKEAVAYAMSLERA